MKKLFGLALLLSFSHAFADEIRVSRMKQDGDLERSFVLTTNISQKVVLDCQSFIQGLRIGEFEEAYTYLLDPWECEELQDRVKSSLRKRQQHCIDVANEIRSDRTCY
ncbi:MAG: hypothetical protein ACLGHN_01595 [Bacteriovoracia bacterium]